MKNLREYAARHKAKTIKNNEDKLKHLKKKYRKSEEDKINQIPESISDLGLEKLSIFDKKKYEDKVVMEYEPEIIGELNLHDNERLILRLPPKFSIEENLPKEGLAMEQELAYAKARMTINKEADEKLSDDEGIGVEEDEDEELEEQMEIIEAETRQIYDPKRRIFDDRKRKVTDLKECARITLPKPMDTNNEAMVEIRRGTNNKIYEQYTEEVCNKKGEVKGNLSEEEKDGFRRLQKRIKENEVVILKTDKSGKMCLVTRDEYMKMGLEHTKKDAEIDRKGIIEKEKQLNGHVFFWAKMWGSGEAHKQRDRIIDSKVVSSEQLADLYLMFKDHKEGKKTRPVVTGCNSNTRGFSNSVSDLLESVNKANKTPYEAISSEDMLAKITRYNKKAEEIMQEGRTHLLKKVMCIKGSGMKLITRCDKLWLKLRSELEVIPGGNSQEELRQGLQGEGCGCEMEKEEETLSYRGAQYEGYANLAGEDIQIVLECDHCGPDLTEEVRQDCGGCGDGWVREDYSLCIIGNDVVSLFPSLDSINRGKIVWGEVARSTKEIGFNTKLGLKYIANQMKQFNLFIDAYH